MKQNRACLAVNLTSHLTLTRDDARSGAHFNPVVSTCLFLIGKLSRLRLVMYVAAQMAGGIFGAALLKVGTRTHAHHGSCTSGCVSGGRCLAAVPIPEPGRSGPHRADAMGACGCCDGRCVLNRPQVSPANGWMSELLTTFTLVFTALRVAVDPINFVRPHCGCCALCVTGLQAKFAPLIIGGVVFVNVTIGSVPQCC